MTLKQKHRYNELLESLRYIASHTKTLDEGKLYCSKHGLDYQEYLETRLEDAKNVAAGAIRNRNYLSLNGRSKD